MRPTSFEQDVNPFYSVCRANAKPSKKAWVTNPLEDLVAEEEEPRGEPEQTGEPEGLHPETTFDDPPLDGQHVGERCRKQKISYGFTKNHLGVHLATREREGCIYIPL